MVKVQQNRIEELSRNVFMLSLAHRAETADARVTSTFQMAKNMCLDPDVDDTMWKLYKDAIRELNTSQCNQWKVDDQEMPFHETSAQAASLPSKQSATDALSKKITNEGTVAESKLDKEGIEVLTWI